MHSIGCRDCVCDNFFNLLCHRLSSHTASSEASMLSKTEIMVMHVTQSDFVFVVLSCGELLGSCLLFSAVESYFVAVCWFQLWRATWQLFVVFSNGELLGSVQGQTTGCVEMPVALCNLCVCCFQLWRATWQWAKMDNWEWQGREACWKMPLVSGLNINYNHNYNCIYPVWL